MGGCKIFHQKLSVGESKGGGLNGIYSVFSMLFQADLMRNSYFEGQPPQPHHKPDETPETQPSRNS